MWDVIVIGGGSSGVAAAISASRNNCKTLLIERLGFLGGTSTASLVTPMMKNMLDSGDNLTYGIYSEVLSRLKQTGDASTHENGNPGWFNPEMMKCILDDICEESKVSIIFEMIVTNAEVCNGKITSITGFSKSGFCKLEAKYFIDATGDADIAAFAGVPYESGEKYCEKDYQKPETEVCKYTHQAMSLRFNMANVDIEAFSNWLNEIDPDTGISSVYKDEHGETLLTTAHTWEDKDWRLRPYFIKAIDDGIIKFEDGAYFQIFSIPGQKNAIAFNCPRIFSEKNLDPLNVWDLSYAQKTGRKQIRRIAEFCKKYLVGFSEAYISQIAPQLGIRDSRRIEGLYKLTENDILNAKKFDNKAAKSNYPIDIHSKDKNKNELKFLSEDNFYEIPIESMIPVNINNLLVVGKTISATFRAQASLRIQPNCWSLGESAGKFVALKVKES